MIRRSDVLILLAVGFIVLAGCSSASTTPVATEASPTASPVPPTTTSTSSPTSSPMPSLPASNGSLEVHFINAGQSVSTLIVGPTGETMLIDSGDWRDNGSLVIEYLERHNITRIDHLVTSHADADHIGGHAAVIAYFETEANGIGAVYDPGIAASTQTYQRYLDAVEQYNVTLFQTREGDHIPFEGVRVQVLAPPEENLASGDRNENSLVLKLAFGETSFLFTGDAEEQAEEYLLSHHASALNVTVFKAGHHGARTSTSGPLLDAVTPKAVVISSAYDSQFGHPHNETLSRLAARNIPTYWTATHGSIRFESNGSAIIVSTQAAATTAPLELRTASPMDPESIQPLTRIDIIRVADPAPMTSSPTPTATDGGTPTTTPGGELTVAEVHADAAGDERENLNDEYIVFENTGRSALNLSEWTVRDKADHVYTFPSGFTLDPGATVTLHTGSGTDSETDLYWDSDAPVWNNGGDTIIVRDAEGELVLEEEY